MSISIAETTTSQEAQEELANELLNQAQNASQLNSSQVKLLFITVCKKNIFLQENVESLRVNFII